MNAEVARFVDGLLAEPPKPPNTVSFVIETGGDPVALFEVLLTVFTTIVRKWYAPPISMRAISHTHKQRIREYFASFGYSMYLGEAGLLGASVVDNSAYVNADRLEDMKFQSVDRGTVFTVSFARIGDAVASAAEN